MRHRSGVGTCAEASRRRRRTRVVFWSGDERRMYRRLTAPWKERSTRRQGGGCLELQPFAQAGVVNLGVALPKVGRQRALDVEVIEPEFDGRFAFAEIAMRVRFADMQAGTVAAVSMVLTCISHLPVDDGFAAEPFAKTRVRWPRTPRNEYSECKKRGPVPQMGGSAGYLSCRWCHRGLMHRRQREGRLGTLHLH